MEEGYAPEAVVNYLCLLGWSPKNNREKVPVNEVIELFDLPQILRHNARFDLNKLHWLNGEYVRDMERDRYYELAVHALARIGIDTNKFPLDYVKAALDTCKEKIKLFNEVKVFADFYFKDQVELETDPATEFTPEVKSRLAKLREAFAGAQAFDAATLEKTLKSVVAELGVKPGLLVHPVRMAATGRAVGPSLYHLLEVLGRDRVLARLDRVLQNL
jgi:glutamyl-tRNA synthetase